MHEATNHASQVLSQSQATSHTPPIVLQPANEHCAASDPGFIADIGASIVGRDYQVVGFNNFIWVTGQPSHQSCTYIPIYSFDQPWLYQIEMW